jgi:polyisoprenoid-binding protein YceI
MKTPHYSILGALFLFAGTVHAADAKLASAPKGTADVTNVPRYVSKPAGSSLAFEFNQAGAASAGAFKQFDVELNYDEKNLAASSLNVKVKIGSIDTQDSERDTALKSADLFDAQKFPVAVFAARSLDKTAAGVVAAGKLTIHGVTKDVRIPLAIRSSPAGLQLSGATTIKRLDYGIGQGDYKATDFVGDDVKITYKVELVKGN